MDALIFMNWLQSIFGDIVETDEVENGTYAFVKGKPPQLRLQISGVRTHRDMVYVHVNPTGAERQAKGHCAIIWLQLRGTVLDFSGVLTPAATVWHLDLAEPDADPIAWIRGLIARIKRGRDHHYGHCPNRSRGEGPDVAD